MHPGLIIFASTVAGLVLVLNVTGVPFRFCATAAPQRPLCQKPSALLSITPFLRRRKSLLVAGADRVRASFHFVLIRPSGDFDLIPPYTRLMFTMKVIAAGAEGWRCILCLRTQLTIRSRGGTRCRHFRRLNTSWRFPDAVYAVFASSRCYAKEHTTCIVIDDGCCRNSGSSYQRGYRYRYICALSSSLVSAYTGPPS